VDIRTFTIGPVQANCYVLYTDNHEQAVVIDPGQGIEPVVEALGETEVAMILLTHGHFDHVAGTADLKKATGAPVMIHKAEAEWLTDPELNSSGLFADVCPSPVAGPAPDDLLEAGQQLEWNGPTITCLHTPGHTPGGVSFYLPSENVIFSGDTLFAGSIGRTDFPGGSYRQLLDSIHRELLGLDKEIRVYPGHGGVTTIGRERKSNPFLQGR